MSTGRSFPDDQINAKTASCLLTECCPPKYTLNHNAKSSNLIAMIQFLRTIDVNGSRAFKNLSIYCDLCFIFWFPIFKRNCFLDLPTVDTKINLNSLINSLLFTKLDWNFNEDKHFVLLWIAFYRCWSTVGYLVEKWWSSITKMARMDIGFGLKEKRLKKVINQK